MKLMISLHNKVTFIKGTCPNNISVTLEGEGLKAMMVKKILSYASFI